MFIEGEERRVKVKVTQSCLTLCDPVDCPWNSPGQNTLMDSLSLLQGIFPTQGLNPGLLYGKWVLYQLSYHGSPKLEISKWGEKRIRRKSFHRRRHQVPWWSQFTKGFKAIHWICDVIVDTAILVTVLILGVNFISPAEASWQVNTLSSPQGEDLLLITLSLII